MAHDDQRCWIFRTSMTICDEKPTTANPIGPPTGGPVQGKLYYFCFMDHCSCRAPWDLH